MRDHLLTSYQKAMVSVVQAQFGMKSFQDGKDGVLSLAAEQGGFAWLMGRGNGACWALAGHGEGSARSLPLVFRCIASQNGPCCGDRKVRSSIL